MGSNEGYSAVAFAFYDDVRFGFLARYADGASSYLGATHSGRTWSGILFNGFGDIQIEALHDDRSNASGLFEEKKTGKGVKFSKCWDSLLASLRNDKLWMWKKKGKKYEKTYGVGWFKICASYY